MLKTNNLFKAQASSYENVPEFGPIKRTKSLPNASDSKKPPDKPIIVVMGPTGSGKSSLIKGLTGSRDIRVGLTLHSGRFFSLSIKPYRH
jgi:putative ribosome biogenesis GTPase RsgA